MKNLMLSLIYYLLHTTIFVNFWGTLGVNWGQKKVKNYPSCLKVTHKYSIFALADIFFEDKLDGFTQNIIFEHFGIPMPPCMYMYKHSFQNKNFMMPVHCPIRYHLCFEQSIYITLHLCQVIYLET